MSIIVTGAGGFVGRQLVARLSAIGRDVVGVDNCEWAPPAGVRAVIGDICSAEVRSELFNNGCSSLIHLATVPGGAAEANPTGARRVNVDATYDLFNAAREYGSNARVVFASTIAVFGDKLPPEGVSDATPLSPKLVYAGQKAMMETLATTMSNRSEIDAVSVRLPAILARPKGPSGMKSAFMSELFHSMRSQQAYVCPVSQDATIWAQSLPCCVDNLIHALTMDSARMPVTRVVTLPAQRFSIRELVTEIAKQCGTSAELIDYAPDPALEAAFGNQPSLRTPAAAHAGFAPDGDLATLVANALSSIDGC